MTIEDYMKLQEERDKLREALIRIERVASWTESRPHIRGFEPTCPLCIAREALGIRNPIAEIYG